MSGESFFIVGGAGFIGSHFVDHLLQSPQVSRVAIFDNLSSGREWHFQHHLSNSRFQFFKGDVKDFSSLQKAMQGYDTVIHLASNPDIARAANEPDIDFREGTYLTQNVAEAARLNQVKNVLYASGSGVYGDIGKIEAAEDFGPLVPISTYGASKLAGEALLSSYSFMFGMRACAFRFGNVVGARQTHGVGFDFVKRLSENPRHLRILGDGLQSKSYIHVSDVIQAVLLAHQESTKPFETFNIATGDYITVREIAQIALECLQLESNAVHFEYTGGDRGWKGDVPIVRLNTDRIKKLGWTCQKTSAEAIRHSIQNLLSQNREGLI